jgi:hypothetical protein
MGRTLVAQVWKWEHFSRTFASRRLAEHFARLWPGYLGKLERVPLDPFDEPIWRVGRDLDGRIVVTAGRATWSPL